MAGINALIAQGAQTQGINPLGLVTGVQNITNARSRNELMQQNKQVGERNIAEFDANATSREDDRLMKSLQAGSQLAMPYIESGDDAALTNYLKARQVTLSTSGIPTIHTDEAIAAMESGDPEQIAQAKSLLVQFATMGQGGGEDFTLSAGSKRFDPQGNLIVDNPKEIAPEKDPEKVRLALEAGLQPGTKEYSDFLLGKGDDEGATRDQRAIASGMRQGLTQAQAENLVFGRTRQEINENTGQIVKVEDIAGKVTEIPVSGGTKKTPTPPPGQSLMDLAEIASGPEAAVTAKAAAALSFFGINPEEASTGAIQTFNTHTTALIRALSINPRFPVAEMERIQKEVNIKPSFFQGAGTLKKKMRSLDESLQLRLDQAERDFNDPGLDVKTRQAQGANASALKNFLSILGANQDTDETTSRIEEIEARLEELRNN